MKAPRDMTLAEVREALKGTGPLAVRFAYASWEAEEHLLNRAIHERHLILQTENNAPRH